MRFRLRMLIALCGLQPLRGGRARRISEPPESGATMNDASLRPEITMKTANLPCLFSAVLAASCWLLQCGGTEADLGTSGVGGSRATSGGTGGSTAGSDVGVGGRDGEAGNFGGAGSFGGDSSFGGDGSFGGAGSNAGGGFEAGHEGSTPLSDAAGPRIDVVTAGDANIAPCPPVAPVSTNLICGAVGDTCSYPGEACTCRRADPRGGNGGPARPRPDAGFEAGSGFDAGSRAVWACERIRDSNPPSCPATQPAKGESCSMVTVSCWYMSAYCACFRSGGRADAGLEWSCN